MLWVIYYSLCFLSTFRAQKSLYHHHHHHHCWVYSGSPVQWLYSTLVYGTRKGAWTHIGTGDNTKWKGCPCPSSLGFTSLSYLFSGCINIYILKVNDISWIQLFGALHSDTCFLRAPSLFLLLLLARLTTVTIHSLVCHTHSQLGGHKCYEVVFQVASVEPVRYTEREYLVVSIWLGDKTILEEFLHDIWRDKYLNTHITTSDP